MTVAKGGDVKTVNGGYVVRPFPGRFNGGKENGKDKKSGTKSAGFHPD